MKGVEELVLAAHRLAARLKELRRAGWVERGVEGAEDVAAHSYAVALISVLLADLRGLDAAEAARMALLHDLPEAETGDLTPGAKARLADLGRRERAVVEGLANLMPRERAGLWLKAWRDYSEGRGEVARLVREVDKLEMGLQAARYARRLGKEALEEIYRSAEEAVEDPALRAALKRAWERLL